MQNVLLGLTILVGLLRGGSDAATTVHAVPEKVNPVAIVIKAEGVEVMSGPEDTGTWRRMHLPPGFIVEQWGKQDQKVFVWSKELDWGGWANSLDFNLISPEEAKQLNHYGQPFSTGLGERVDVPVSLSPATLEAILRDGKSPVPNDEPDFAAYIYKRSFYYNIDPAYLLAFFKKESSYGTAGAPVYNKNIGNIVCTPGYQCDGRWRKYDTWKASADDWFNLLVSVYVGQGLNSISKIIPVYAPASQGNNVGLYIYQINSLAIEYREREQALK